MTNELVKLTSNLLSAIEKTKYQIDKKYPNQKLFGYALCTTDDLSGVYHVACTSEWVNKNSKGFEEIGYISVEWEESGDDTEFDYCNSLIHESYEMNKDDFETWRDLTFQALVTALQQAREAGLFEDHTHLSAGSTDPSEHMELLETQGIDIMNPPNLADSLVNALGFSKYRNKAR